MAKPIFIARVPGDVSAEQSIILRKHFNEMLPDYHVLILGSDSISDIECEVLNADNMPPMGFEQVVGELQKMLEPSETAKLFMPLVK